MTLINLFLLTLSAIILTGSYLFEHARHEEAAQLAHPSQHSLPAPPASSAHI